MRSRDMIPEIVVYSPARRTAQTVDCLLRDWASAPPTEPDRSLYLAEPEQIAARIRNLPNTRRSALIVGHNPGFEDFAGALAGRGPAEAIARMNDKFPTCALAIFEIDVDRWNEITRTKSRLTGFYVAKDLVPDGGA